MWRSSRADVTASAAQAKFNNAENMDIADRELVDQITYYGYAFAGHRDWSNTVVLECAPEGSPYNIEDVLSAVENASYSHQIQYVGPMSLNYLMVVKFTTKIAADEFLSKKLIQVKGKQARIARIGDSQVVITLLWIPPDVSDDAVSLKFSQYGEIRKSVRVKCTRPGFQHVETTSRMILLELNPETTVEQLPYIVKIDGLRIAVGIRNRPPMCYRCRTIGHTRAKCTAPHCNRCRRYGHKAEACATVSYAGVVRGNANAVDELAGLDNSMCEAEMGVDESSHILPTLPTKPTLPELGSGTLDTSDSFPAMGGVNSPQPGDGPDSSVLHTSLPLLTGAIGPAWGDSPMLPEASTELPDDAAPVSVADSGFVPSDHLTDILPGTTTETTSVRTSLTGVPSVEEGLRPRAGVEPSLTAGGKWVKEARGLVAKKGSSIEAIGRRLHDLRANRVNPYVHGKASHATGLERAAPDPTSIGEDESRLSTSPCALDPVGSGRGHSTRVSSPPSLVSPANNRFTGIAEETI